MWSGSNFHLAADAVIVVSLSHLAESTLLLMLRARSTPNFVPMMCSSVDGHLPHHTPEIHLLVSLAWWTFPSFESGIIAKTASPNIQSGES